MNDLELDYVEGVSESGEPQVTFSLRRGGGELITLPVLLFSEEDVVSASNELALAGVNQAEADQALAEVIEPVRIRQLREREQQESAVEEQKAPPPPQYQAVFPT